MGINLCIYRVTPLEEIDKMSFEEWTGWDYARREGDREFADAAGQSFEIKTINDEYDVYWRPANDLAFANARCWVLNRLLADCPGNSKRLIDGLVALFEDPDLFFYVSV